MVSGGSGGCRGYPHPHETDEQNDKHKLAGVVVPISLECPKEPTHYSWSSDHPPPMKEEHFEKHVGVPYTTWNPWAFIYSLIHSFPWHPVIPSLAIRWTHFLPIPTWLHQFCCFLSTSIIFKNAFRPDRVLPRRTHPTHQSRTPTQLQRYVTRPTSWNDTIFTRLLVLISARPPVVFNKPPRPRYVGTSL